MKKTFSLLFFVLFLSACSAGTASPQQTETSTARATPSATMMLARSITPTPTASQTPAPPTITPLPTIPTFTPTFDVRRIVTVTPAPKTDCRLMTASKSVLDFGSCDAKGNCGLPPSHDDVLNYLNAGGSLNTLAQQLHGERTDYGKVIDLTGDGMPEVVYIDFEIGKLFIYQCADKQYVNVFEFKGTQGNLRLDAVDDLNKNGMPELILSNYERRGFHSIQIFEWDGSQFRSLMENKITTYTGETVIYDWVGGTDFQYTIMDTNGDGLKEINAVDEPLHGDPGMFASELPLRSETVTIGWNGEHFVVIKQGQYTSPQYRFQDVQDADQLVLAKDYRKALALYQEAIFNRDLDWWSKDRKRYETEKAIYDYSNRVVKYETPLPTIAPAFPDTSEYPRLAAYAYYRMIVLHIRLGEMDAAQTPYATLQAKFPADSPGHPYAEMASQFWDAYQSTGKLYNACAAAIAFADAHPEILTPLGSDYHGSQSHIYVPADVCPFR